MEAKKVLLPQVVRELVAGVGPGWDALERAETNRSPDIIHLKSVADADAGHVPAGWTQVFHETVAGTGYTTFYALTPH